MRRTFQMAAATKSIELHPSGPPRKLSRPDGFKTTSISVGFDGDAIRLLTSEGQADALVAREERPEWASFPKTHTDSEYSSIVSVSGHSVTRDTIVRVNSHFPQN